MKIHSQNIPILFFQSIKPIHVPDSQFDANWAEINWPAFGRVIFISSFATFSMAIYDFLQIYTLFFTKSWFIVSKLGIFQDRLFTGLGVGNAGYKYLSIFIEASEL
jgi:hypothetical protein